MNLLTLKKSAPVEYVSCFESVIRIGNQPILKLRAVKVRNGKFAPVVCSVASPQKLFSERQATYTNPYDALKEASSIAATYLRSVAFTLCKET